MATERELILAKREGFMTHCRCVACAREAARQFPLPSTRPRIVLDHEKTKEWGAAREWRCVDGALESRTVGVRLVGEQAVRYPWTRRVTCIPTPKRCATWADLLANPDELVDDDGEAQS